MINAKIIQPWIMGLCMYLLDHITESSDYAGPLVYVNAFNMETTIEQVKKGVNSKKKKKILALMLV
jgi:hypothetical protein